jgi:hypothetical protein
MVGGTSPVSKVKCPLNLPTPFVIYVRVADKSDRMMKGREANAGQFTDAEPLDR